MNSTVNMPDPIIERIEVIEKENSIEMIYKETPSITNLLWNSVYNDNIKCFKIIFSCVEGKWHKSDKIYGEVIPAQPQTYKFNN